ETTQRLWDVRLGNRVEPHDDLLRSRPLWEAYPYPGAAKLRFHSIKDLVATAMLRALEGCPLRRIGLIDLLELDLDFVDGVRLTLIVELVIRHREWHIHSDSAIACFRLGFKTLHNLRIRFHLSLQEPLCPLQWRAVVRPVSMAYEPAV